MSMLGAFPGDLLTLAIGSVLFLAAFWIWRWVSIVVHEAGHVAAGRLAGIALDHVRIGAGRVARAFHVRGVKWIWHRHPLCGWVSPRPDATPSRRQTFFFVLGGPIATAALAAILWWATWAASAARWPGFELLRILALTELATLLVTLWPARMPVLGTEMENDGMLMWQALFPPKSTENSKARSLLLEAAKAASDERRDACAAKSVEAMKASEPREEEEVYHAAADLLIRSGKPEEAAAAFRALLDTFKPGDPKFLRLADAFGSLALFQDARSIFPECEALLRKALAQVPGAKSAAETLASLLVERGCDEEAEPQLRALHATGETDLDVGIPAAYLSMIAARRGNLAESLKFRRQALNLLPEMPLVQRVLGTGRAP